MLSKILVTIIAVAVAGSLTAAPKTPQKQRSPGKAAGKRSADKKSNARSRQAARPSGPARQLAPTPDRYMEVQQALADRGYYTGPINGVWTSECVDALKKFQADQNIGSDGKLGALSLIALGLGPKHEPLDASAAQPSTAAEPTVVP